MKVLVLHTIPSVLGGAGRAGKLRHPQVQPTSKMAAACSSHAPRPSLYNFWLVTVPSPPTTGSVPTPHSKGHSHGLPPPFSGLSPFGLHSWLLLSKHAAIVCYLPTSFSLPSLSALLSTPGLSLDSLLPKVSP